MYFLNQKIAVHFGNKHNTPFTIEEIKQAKLTNNQYLQSLANTLKIFPIQQYFFLNQTHTNSGHEFNATAKSFELEGDFIITNQPNIALSILTADCLPIIFYDTEHHAIAITHAGWRGSLASITKKTVEALQTTYASEPQHLLVFFGPSAKTCCYEVTQEFLKQLNKTQQQQCIRIKKDKLFFDNVLYNILELQKLNIPTENINLEFNECTMCYKNYASYRRYGLKSPLQISAIYLK